MAPDIFVSYARRDDSDGLISELAERLREAYGRYLGAKLDVFMDSADIQVGERWNRRLEAELESSRLVLALLSPSYFRSQYCLKEWDASQGRQSERILPVEVVPLKDEEHDFSAERQLNEEQRLRWDQAHELQIVSWYDAKVDEREAMSFLRGLVYEIGERLSVPGSDGETPPTIRRDPERASGRVPPAEEGGLPPGASNRVPREIDGELDLALKRHPFCIAIDGPPLSGKSTVLNRWVEVARGRGFDVAHFDCEVFADSLLDKDEQLCQALTEIGREIAQEWGLQPPADRLDGGPAFLRWLGARRQPGSKRPGLLVVDELTKLRHATIGAISGCLRWMQGRRDRLNLSVALTRSPRTVALHAWMLHSSAVYFPVFKVGPFDAEREVPALVEVYPEWNDAEAARSLYDEFRGQPFVTHLAVDRIAKGERWEEVREAAAAGRDRFQHYEKAIKRAFREEEHDVTGMAKAVYSSRDGLDDPGTPASRLLVWLGLVRPEDGGEDRLRRLRPHDSEFYRRLVRRLASKDSRP